MIVFHFSYFILNNLLIKFQHVLPVSMEHRVVRYEGLPVMANSSSDFLKTKYPYVIVTGYNESNDISTSRHDNLLTIEYE